MRQTAFTIEQVKEILQMEEAILLSLIQKNTIRIFGRHGACVRRSSLEMYLQGHRPSAINRLTLYDTTSVVIVAETQYGLTLRKGFWDEFGELNADILVCDTLPIAMEETHVEHPQILIIDWDFVGEEGFRLTCQCHDSTEFWLTNDMEDGNGPAGLESANRVIDKEFTPETIARTVYDDFVAL